MKGRILIIAGSDSGGGAGIQADIKTVTALGAYAATAITAVTAQNTHGVTGIVCLPPEFVRQQIDAVLDDIGADAIKIGMLGNAEIVEAVAIALEARDFSIPIIVDPVMIAKGGASLLGHGTDPLRERLIPLATVLTPNLPEAEFLLERKIATAEDMIAAAQDLRSFGAATVLLKGGHLDSPEIVDVLATETGVTLFRSPRIASKHTHGTGCTLASAIATGLAQGLDLAVAVTRARSYVLQAIRTAPGFGGGHGPLNHSHAIPLSHRS